MKILEAEIDLRTQTRVAEQARSAVADEDYRSRARVLEVAQGELRIRTDDVIDRIESLPKPEDFKKEISLLTRVSDVMGEAEEILASPSTGPRAIAAETEAIELLLQTKRNNGGGGGGGSNPSPSGTRSGETNVTALALLGEGSNGKGLEKERKVSQISGMAGEGFPEEFRLGLDKYFERLESEK